MATSKKVNGKQAVYFQLSSLSAPVTAINIGDDMKDFEFGVEGETEAETFYEYSVGLSSQAITATLVFSGQKTSAYQILWNNAGKEVPFVFGRWGSATAQTDKPIFVGVVRLPNRPGFTGSAGADNDEFEVEFQIVSGDWEHAA